MKLFKIIITIAAAMLATCACSKLEVVKLAPESEYVAPVLNGPGSITLTASDIASDKVTTFTWSLADFGQPTEIYYNINASYNGKSTVMFALLRGCDSYSVAAGELSNKLVSLGVPKGKTVNVTFNIDCTFGSNFSTLKSADKTISVYTD